MLKQITKQVLNNLRLTRETKTASYAVTKQFDADSDAFVVIPLPLVNQRQRLLGYDLNFEADRISSNNYNLLLAKVKQPKLVKLKYRLEVKPVNLAVQQLNYIRQQSSFDKKIIDKINPYDQEIISIANRITSNSTIEFVKQAYNLVINKLRYGKPIKGLYSYKQALTLDYVDCGGFCTLLASILLVRKIPVELVVGELYTSRTGSAGMHVWLEIKLKNNQRFPLDPSVDWRNRHFLSSRFAGFGKLSSYHIVLSYGLNHKLPILNQRVELFQSVLKYKNV
ncbi:MAG: hypothetical protein KatS3mg091_511 [Patescibacteria group bacterium]|nr:MAG: hypothetical protein KatS3mg091_511 [Patescibacteria group bacterium]